MKSDASLRASGIKVHVIGFATSDSGVIANLDAIANAGGTTSGVLVSDSASLATSHLAIA